MAAGGGRTELWGLRPARLRRLGMVTMMMTVGATGSGCAHPGEHGQPVVRKLSFTGTRQVSAGSLSAGIATTATGWWWPFATEHYYDPFTWQTDLRRIERIYQSRGFFAARVVSDTVKPVKDGVALSVVVQEGLPTLVSSFTVQGLDTLDQQQRAGILRGIAFSGPFVEAKWQAAKATLGERLRNLGYARAAVEGRALLDPGTRRADLLLVVQLGTRYRFGAIQIHQEAAHRLVALWIWEQVRLAIPDGSYYTEALLGEAHRRLAGMGVFAEVKVSAGEPAPAGDRLPIVVDVREAPLHTMRVGLGAEFDQVRNEGRAIAEWSHLDFLGGMRRLTIHGEAGWAFIPNVYAVASDETAEGPRSGPVAIVRTEIEQPRFLHLPSLHGKAALAVERTLEQSYDAVGATLSTGVAWQPRAFLSVYASYNLQAYYLNGPAIASVSAAPLTLGCVSQTSSCFVLLSYLEQIVAVDRRDSTLEPHTGYYASASFQEGGGPLGGDFTYLRILPDLRGYYSFGAASAVTLSARLRVGELLHTGADSAVVTRFFAGGGVSMRGFSDRRLSPLLLAPAPTTQIGAPITLTLPVGGNGMVDGSFEMRVRLTHDLSLAAFVDYGQVTPNLIGPNDLPTLLWAVGLGLRYQTPAGPVRIDVARRLQLGRPPPLYAVGSGGAITEVPYAVNNDCFGLGGSGRATPVTDSSCVLSVAIGEAF